MIALLIALGIGETRLPVSLQEELPDDRSRVTMTIVQRFSVPDGDLGSGVDYEDFFDFGYGLGVEVDYLMPAGLGWRTGPYLSVGWDWFTGQEETVQGVRLEADPLAIFSVLVGFKGMLDVDPRFHLELRLGVGFSHFLPTDAEVVGTGTTVELLDASTELAGEAGLRAVFYLGKLMKLDFGGAVRMRGSAEEGEVPLNPDTMLQYVLDIGVGFRF